MHLSVMKKNKRTNETNKRIIKGLLENAKCIKLELGAGKRRMEGWTSIDLDEDADLRLDLRKPLPFPCNSVSEIYASHVLEHCYFPKIRQLVAECHRILVPGGTFKVVVPNARIYLEAYWKGNDFDYEYYCRYKPAFHYNSPIDYVNYMAYMDGHHRYMFDEDNLIKVLESEGFLAVTLREYDSLLDLERRRYESIYAEAMK